MRFIFLSLFFLLNSPLEAKHIGGKPHLKLNECTETTVEKLFTSLSKEFIGNEWESFGMSWEDQTGIINFSNDLTVYLYRNLKATNSKWTPLKISGSLDFKDAKSMYLNGDKVNVCLKFIPTECRKKVPDIRGEIYSITNQRTRKTHYGHYGRNQCGGA